jgi:hypothetical protein
MPAGARPFSPLASVRLRVLIPASELARRTNVVLVPLRHFIEDPELRNLGRPRSIVLGKLSSHMVLGQQAELQRMLDRMAARPTPQPIFADVSDDYAAMAELAGKPFLAEYLAALAETCRLVVPCRALCDALAPFAKNGIEIVEDPFESSDCLPPRVAPSDVLRLCWFGNLGLTNLDELTSALCRLAADSAGRQCQLEIVAGEGLRPAAERMGRAVHAHNPAWSLQYTGWTLESARGAIARSDFVVLPQDAASKWGRVKSHNRLVETLRAGRLAIASPIPSYLELADYAWVGDSLARGLAWATENSAEAQARVVAGQLYVAQRFAPSVVAGRWASVLGIDA